MIWRKELKGRGDGQMAPVIEQAVMVEPIGDEGAINRVTVDLGIGIPMTGLMYKAEVLAFTKALQDGGWNQESNEKGGWKL